MRSVTILLKTITTCRSKSEILFACPITHPTTKRTVLGFNYNIVTFFRSFKSSGVCCLENELCAL